MTEILGEELLTEVGVALGVVDLGGVGDVCKTFKYRGVSSASMDQIR